MKLIDVRPEERRPTAWAAAWFFCVLAAYYVIRPVRETLASELSRDARADLFVGTLVAMLVATPIYGWVTTRLTRRRLAPVIYAFFTMNLPLFWFVLSREKPPLWAGGAFFVWISVFNLFVVTLFWATIVDVFNGEQGKRLFGPIMAAGTLGQIAASASVQTLAERLGTANLLWISLALLIAAVLCALRLERITNNAGPQQPRREAGLQAAMEGAAAVFRSPYLAGIALLVVSLSVAATAVYFQMTDLAAEAIPDRDDRTAWFAQINQWHGYLTLAFQSVVAAWLLRTIGVAWTLALVPLVYACGFATIAVSQSLAALAAFQVALRVASFAFGNPAMEVLYTAVAPMQKYRAKAFIDTVGKRTGDVAGGKGYALLRALGWTPATVALALLPATLLLAGLCLLLGGAYKQAQRVAAEIGQASGHEVE